MRISSFGPVLEIEGLLPPQAISYIADINHLVLDLWCDYDQYPLQDVQDISNKCPMGAMKIRTYVYVLLRRFVL